MTKKSHILLYSLITLSLYAQNCSPMTPAQAELAQTLVAQIETSLEKQLTAEPSPEPTRPTYRPLLTTLSNITLPVPPPTPVKPSLLQRACNFIMRKKSITPAQTTVTIDDQIADVITHMNQEDLVNELTTLNKETNLPCLHTALGYNMTLHVIRGIIAACKAHNQLPMNLLGTKQYPSALHFAMMYNTANKALIAALVLQEALAIDFETFKKVRSHSFKNKTALALAKQNNDQESVALLQALSRVRSKEQAQDALNTVLS